MQPTNTSVRLLQTRGKCARDHSQHLWGEEGRFTRAKHAPENLPTYMETVNVVRSLSVEYHLELLVTK